MRWKTVIVFFVGGVVGFVMSYSLQSLLEGYVASTIKRSMANARTISTALEHYKQDNGRYPDVSDSAQLSSALVPKYIREVPTDMYSGRPYVVISADTVPAIIAPGRGGFIVQKGEVLFFEPYRRGNEQPIGKK
ncbi:MAG TPA: hypothetical protein VII75_16770 [Thermoanaerobaculia bacterium]